MLSKLGQIKKTLDNIYNKNNLVAIPPNKNKRKKFIFVKDGFITYKITFNIYNIECQCSGQYLGQNIFCDHVLYLISSHFGLSDKSICFLDHPQIMIKFIEGIKKSIIDINGILEKEIDNFLDREMCGICFVELGDKRFNLDLYVCRKCKNYVHSKCFDKWLKFKQDRRESTIEKGCVYCREKINIG